MYLIKKSLFSPYTHNTGPIACQWVQDTWKSDKCYCFAVMIITSYTDHVIMGCCCSLFCTIINSSHNINHIATWQWHVHQNECTQCLSQSISVWLILLWGNLYVHHQVLHQPLRHHNERDGIWTHQSHTPVTPAKLTRNQPQTDKNHQIRGEIGFQSVLIRFCRFSVALCSGRQICRGEIFQTCLKDFSPTNCRLSVGHMSVWCRFCRGVFRDVSVLIRPPMVDCLSVLDRLCIGHMSADLTPINDQFKTESSPT